MPRPSFALHSDDESPTPRSLSHERTPHLHQPPPLSSHNSHNSRRYSQGQSTDSDRGSPAPAAHHLLCDVDEEASLGLETDALLTPDRKGRNKRRHSIQASQYGSYGTTGGLGNSETTGSGLFLALNEGGGGGGAALQRQESVLRVRRPLFTLSVSLADRTRSNIARRPH
jgi:hypothetical protein